MSERIYDERHDYDSDHCLHLEVTDDTQALRLLTIDGDQSTVIQLSEKGVHALRLALQRYERNKRV